MQEIQSKLKPLGAHESGCLQFCLLSALSDLSWPTIRRIRASPVQETTRRCKQGARCCIPRYTLAHRCIARCPARRLTTAKHRRGQRSPAPTSRVPSPKPSPSAAYGSPPPECRLPEAPVDGRPSKGGAAYNQETNQVPTFKVETSPRRQASIDNAVI